MIDASTILHILCKV